MADASLLASIISGTNPLDPTMLGAYQGAQLSNAGLDPNFGHNEGLFGALGKMIAAARGGPMLQQGVEQATAANTAAMPDLAKLLSSPDAYGAINANTNPIAAARLLQGATPETAANARLLGEQAALKQLDVAGYQRAAAAAAAGNPLGAVPPGGKNGNGGAALGLIPQPASFTAMAGTAARPVTDADVNALGAQLATMPDAAAQARLQQVKTTSPKLYALWLAHVKGGANAARP
jgi:hypothetical protein